MTAVQIAVCALALFALLQTSAGCPYYGCCDSCCEPTTVTIIETSAPSCCCDPCDPCCGTYGGYNGYYDPGYNGYYDPGYYGYYESGYNGYYGRGRGCGCGCGCGCGGSRYY